MKIGSHIKPRNGKARHVAVHGKEYTFAPVKDNRGAIHFVADVTDADHAELLMKNGAFYAFDPAMAVQATLKRTKETPKDPPAPPQRTVWPTAIINDAMALLDHNADEIGALTGNVSSLDVLRAAMEFERGGKNRKTALTAIEGALKGAVEAGVTT